MPRIPAGELMVAYEVRGSGPPLLMLHGFEGNRHSYDHFIPRLEDRFTVITYDQRDCGDTSGPEREYDSFQHAQDAAELLSALGHDSAFIYGQSNGGVIAQALAINHPERIERLILAVTTPGRRGVLRPDASNSALKALLDRRPVTQVSPERFFAPGAFERRPELKQVFSGRRRGPPDLDRLRRRALALEGFDSLDQLAGIRMPTLVIGGKADQMFPAVNSWLIAERIPNARLVVLEEVGHALTWEAPELVASLIVGFLTEHAQA